MTYVDSDSKLLCESAAAADRDTAVKARTNCNLVKAIIIVLCGLSFFLGEGTEGEKSARRSIKSLETLQVPKRVKGGGIRTGGMKERMKQTKPGYM